MLVRHRPHDTARVWRLSSADFTGHRDRPLRRRAEGHHPRAEIRSARDTRAASRGAHEGCRCGDRRRCGCGGPGAAPQGTTANARLQPGARARTSPRRARRRRARPHAQNASAGRSAGIAAARERQRGVRGDGCGRPARGTRGGVSGRREYDRRHVECVCGTAGGGGGERGTGAYRGARPAASRRSTALMTSAATASFSRSPSSRSQLSDCACRR